MKKAKLLFIGAIIGVIGLTSFGLHSFVVAQDAGQGLTVSPPSQDVSIDPGGTTTIRAKLRNPSNATLPIAVHVEDFTAKGDEGQVELTANSPYSVASWATVSPTEFTLAPGETKEITAVIKAPKNAAGGHFGSFVFEIKPANQSGSASVTQEIASLFLVKVNGTVNEKLNLSAINAPSYSEFGPIPFSLKFENTGNVYTKTYGLVNVTDMFGHKVADIVVPGANVFPNAERIVQASLNKKFLIGNYTATALMYYGTTQTQSLTATTTFFVFPTRIFIGVVVILFILYLMRKRLAKSLKALFG